MALNFKRMHGNLVFFNSVAVSETVKFLYTVALFFRLSYVFPKPFLWLMEWPFRSKCPIRGTFFVKHDYNNYQMIERLYYRGNEIAVNSVTGRNLQGPFINYVNK